MTRCSELCLLLTLALPGAVRAETLVADAFGLFDPATDTGGRRDWAGLQGDATQVAAGAPDQIMIYAGPKSLVAGVDPGQVVAILVDRRGNMVPDDIPVSMVIGGKTVTVESRDGLAATLFQPDPVAGELPIGAAAGDRQSARAMVTVVADIASVAAVLEDPLPEARAETVFEVTSAPLADRFGNPLADGTGATVLLAQDDGSYSLAFGITLRDRASNSFIARDIAGEGTARLAMGSSVSPAIPLSVYTPQAAALPGVEIAPLTDISALRVTLGPFLTKDGYELTDGAPVDVTAVLVDGQALAEQVWLLDGRASLLLPVASPASVATLSIQSPLGAMDLTQAWQSASESIVAGQAP